MTTNIGYVIDAREIERQFSIPVARLINDFLANGYGLLTLDDAQTITLQVLTCVAPARVHPARSRSPSLSLSTATKVWGEWVGVTCSWRSPPVRAQMAP